MSSLWLVRAGPSDRLGVSGLRAFFPAQWLCTGAVGRYLMLAERGLADGELHRTP